MTALWKLEYFDDPNWISIVGKFSQTVEELKGHEQADIVLPNTSDDGEACRLGSNY